MSTDHGSPPLPPEPKTPGWLTALGAVLFLSAAVWWVASQPPAPPSAPMPVLDAGTPGDAGAPH
ncbi:MAG: hypothetical protein ACLQVI_05615 [Polyangiaceae bacterium]